MKILILLLLISTSQLFASKILSYNIYERSDRVDMMLTFDTPYEGSIKQHASKSKIIIKLTDADIESPKVKSVNSTYVNKLTITPMSKETQIIASIENGVKLSVSKTSDAYGLRLRFSKKVASKKVEKNILSTPSLLPSLETKEETQVSMTYVVVVILLLIAVIALFILKSKLTSGSTGGWLSIEKEPKENVKIRFQKALDPKNRVVMLDYAEESYLVVLGNSNILLDKFEGQSIRKESQFESMLNDKRDSLDSFLQIDKQDADEPLSSYKEKASNLDYRL